MSCFQELKSQNIQRPKVLFKARTTWAEPAFEKDLIANLLDRDFETNVLKALREHVKKDVKKMMDKQNRYINKGIENFKEIEKNFWIWKIQ